MSSGTQAQILKLRGNIGPKADLEQLLEAQRGPDTIFSHTSAPFEI